MEAKTYTTRHNARRAGVQSGLPTERVVITVHKAGEDVRFGFAERDAGPGAAKGLTSPALLTPAVATVVVQLTAGRETQEVSNGVKRPAPGGVCRAVWDWLDAHPSVSAKDAKAAAAAHRWNENNVSCEYYAWRKFHGVSRVGVCEGRASGAAFTKGTVAA